MIVGRRAAVTFDPHDIDAITAELAASGWAYLQPADPAFDHDKASFSLGEPVSQYAGELVRDVRPDPKYAEATISASNMKSLSPHTESFEFAGLPPRLVYLWAVQAADGPGGETTVCDFRKMVGSFERSEDSHPLAGARFSWRSPASLSQEGVNLAQDHPFIEDTEYGPCIRYSTHEMRPLPGDDSGLAARLLAYGSDFYDRHHRAVKIEKGCSLVWDNWRMTHSRTAFEDPTRHLRRILIGPRRLP